jgi:hypothetical protein
MPSERLGATLGQVIFLWVRAKECVVVTTTNREERLGEYLGVGELGSYLSYLFTGVVVLRDYCGSLVLLILTFLCRYAHKGGSQRY